MSDKNEDEPGEIIKSDAPKPDGLKKDEVFDPERTPEDEEHARRMKELFGDLGDDEEDPETIDDVRADRNDLAAQVERLKASVARTRKENSALMQQVNEGKEKIAAVEDLRSKDKKSAAKEFLSELVPVSEGLAAGLREIDAAERAANPKLDKLTVGVENTMNQLTNVFNKYGVKASPAPATPENTAPAAPETPASPETPATPEAPAAETPAPAANNEGGDKPVVVETLESLQAERSALQAEAAQLASTVGRAQTDNLTLTRRIEEGKTILAREEAKRLADQKYDIEKPLKDLMPVLDTLEAGLKLINGKARKDDPNLELLATAVDTTLSNVAAVFNKYGITQMDPMGQPFDEENHEAVTLAQVPGYEPSTVVQVVQKGYKLHDRNVRNAKVVVTPPEA